MSKDKTTDEILCEEIIIQALRLVQRNDVVVFQIRLAHLLEAAQALREHRA